MYYNGCFFTKNPLQALSPKTRIDVGLATLYPLHPAPPSRECLYKVASPGKTPEKTTIDVGLATLYPLHPAPPSRECLYKVASPGKTPEKTTIDVGLATLYSLHPIPPSRECLYKVASPGKTPEKTTLYCHCSTQVLPVVPHKAAAEVSKIGNL